MKGTPFRIEIGPRDLKNNAVMLVRRDGKKESVSMDGLVESMRGRIMDFQAELLENARKEMMSHVKDCATLDEAKEYAGKGIAKVVWCGEKECGLRMENVTDARILGEPESMHGSGVCPVCGKPADKIILIAKTY